MTNKLSEESRPSFLESLVLAPSLSRLRFAMAPSPELLLTTDWRP